MINLTPASLMLSGEDTLKAVREAVWIAQDWRRRNSHGPSGELDLLAKALSAALSASGQADTPEVPPEESELVGTEAAAKLLGWDPRTVRRRALELDGKRIGKGPWMVGLRAINEHIDGRNLE